MKNKGLKIFLGFIGAVLLAIALFLGIYNLLNGNRGKKEIESLNAAYNNSVKNGFDGSMADWLSSIDEKFSYEVAVENGFHGTKEEWYTNLIDIINNYMKDEPDPLTYGITNVQVIDGNLVFTFSDGSTINVGTIGKSGSNGEAGADGESGAGGAQGPAGKDGKDGKDGSSIENLEKVTFVEDPAGSKKYYLEFTWTVDGVDQTERTETYIDVSSITVVDDLNTDDGSVALSARQGKKLADTLRINDFSSNPNTYLKIDGSGNLSFSSTAGSSISVIDNLNSTSATDALSANQGKVLKDLVDTKLNANQGTANAGKYLKVTSTGAIEYVDISSTGAGLPTGAAKNQYLGTDSSSTTAKWMSPSSSLSSAGDNDLVTAKAVKDELNKKVNTAQGTTNAGKILKVGADGNLALVDSTAAITVDSALSDTSTNPVQNKVINTALNGKVSIAQGAANKDKILKVNDSGNLVLVDSTAAITVDSALSDTSTNPVQNKVINTALNGKVNKTGYTDADKGKYLYINDSKEVALGTIPDALPAIGDNAYNYLRVKSDKSGSEWTKAIDDASKIGTSTLANDLVTAGAINTALSGKVNVSQGAENKDKILKVNASGNLELADGAVSYTGDWDGTTVLADGNPLAYDDFTVLDPLIGAINVDDSNSEVAHIPAVYKNMIEAARVARSLDDAEVKSLFGYDTDDHILARGLKYKGNTAMKSASVAAGGSFGTSKTTILTNVVLDDFGHIEWIDTPLNIFPITDLPGPGGYLAASSDDMLYWEDAISLNDEDAFSLANKSKLLKAQDADIYIESKIAGLVIPKTNEGIGADSDTKIDDYSEEYVKTLTKTDSPAAGSDAEAINKKIELYSKKIFSKSSPITFGDRYYIALDTSVLRNMYISFAPNDSTDTSKPMSMHTLIVERDQATDTGKLTFTEYNGSTISMDEINNSNDPNKSEDRKTLATLAFNHSLQGLLDSIPEETIKSSTFDIETYSNSSLGTDKYTGSITRDDEEKVLMKMPDGTVGWSSNITIPVLDLSTMVKGEVWHEIPGDLPGSEPPLKAEIPWTGDFGIDIPRPGEIDHYRTNMYISNFFQSEMKTTSTTYNLNNNCHQSNIWIDGPSVPYQYVAVLDEDAIGPSFRESLFYGDTREYDDVELGYNVYNRDDPLNIHDELRTIPFSELEYGAPCPLLVTFTNNFGFSGKTDDGILYLDKEEFWDGFPNESATNNLGPLRSYLFQPVRFRIGKYYRIPISNPNPDDPDAPNVHAFKEVTDRIYTEITYSCIVFDEGVISDSAYVAGNGEAEILILKLAFYPEGNYLTDGTFTNIRLCHDPGNGYGPIISYNFGTDGAPCIKMTLQRGTWKTK